ncbi:DEAD/DEAH box helicase family protein [Prevotella sp. P2-180]|uniref:DEAD/DEAH box helicase family protein n=1 Tax=Prevotella sp. P2-180 TaxID=2024224 RepID=UPI000B9620B3|nr:DEAD/DEAH box helicase family protein [Prevotella sp. P2-180]OYP67984.1 DNA repair helicase [Prevotella sp. P2-180]
MLKNSVLWPKSRRFKSKSEWEPAGFFSEALCNATQFDLKLGFFSSSAINVLSDGFAAFLYNGGRMRLVINDILSENDKEAIMTGESDLDLPFFNLQDIESIRNRLSNRDKHFFECLSWLIRNKQIEIKIIAPKYGNGIAHSKCGIFSDGLNRVAFDGSCNFSRSALLSNIESITAFCDWDGEGDIYKVNDIAEDFEVTFQGKDETVIYRDTSEIETYITTKFDEKELCDLIEDEKHLIDNRMAEEIPSTIKAILSRAQSKVSSIIEKNNVSTGNIIANDAPRFPYSEPRPYQRKAFENWKSNRQKGLFAMATGTGKTLTSLNCLLNIYNQLKYYKAIILVPTVTLVDQWEEECKKFNFKNITKVCSKNHKWKSDIDAIKLKEDLSFDNSEVSYIIIATYASFARDTIFHDLVSFSKKTCKQLLFIADEAHNMGAGRILDRIEGIKFLRRIGLSATPDRKYDDVGNAAINKFFGCENGYTFTFDMREAIDKGYLCRYKYYPHLVTLTSEELLDYIKISIQLSKFFNYESNSFPSSNDILTRLLLKRKRIIHKARNKETVFKSILEERYKEKGNLKYTLVYVPEGTRTDDDNADVYDCNDEIKDDDYTDSLIDVYSEIAKNVSNTTTVKKFMSGIKDRDVILEQFAKGEIEVLTSMKCLDEGVDVPRSEMAIFCASTGNPRQFIQRRGRILRKHEDKHIAIIHDLVVAPVIDPTSESYNMERNLLKNELLRVRNFATLSENSDYAYSELEDILNYYGLHLF